MGKYDDIKTGAIAVAGIAALAFAMWLIFIRSPVETDQIGFRGVAMEQGQFAKQIAENAVAAEADAAQLAEWNEINGVYDLVPDDGSEERASEIYENVQVLGHLSDANFNRFMAQITAWVAPNVDDPAQGCAYCHANADGEIENFASDDNYAKLVSRRMIQMTQTINSEWSQHVGAAGVNCYTCHRGKNVPEYLWFFDPETEASKAEARFIGERNGQNNPTEANGFTDLNADPFTPYLLEAGVARVVDDVPITSEQGPTIQETEQVYSAMVNWSRSLGVNCTYCHNSRAFTSWEQSPPTRALAWHGKEMARTINNAYLVDLGPVYPENRLGPLGDAPKLYCATCHQGASKPLGGMDMVSQFPSLQAPGAADQQDPPTGLTAQ